MSFPGSTLDDISPIQLQKARGNRHRFGWATPGYGAIWSARSTYRDCPGYSFATAVLIDMSVAISDEGGLTAVGRAILSGTCGMQLFAYRRDVGLQ